MSVWSASKAIFLKDLRAERRGRELLITMLVFAVQVILVFLFAFELNAGVREASVPGVLWTTIIFAGTLGLSRSMAAEREQGCLDGLMLLPCDRTAIYFGKTAANWIFMLVVCVILLPLYSFFSGVNLLVPGLAGVLLLGTLGYTAVGTLLATLTVRIRSREMLLPVLLLPVLVPLILACLRATTLILQGDGSAELQTWLMVLTAYNLAAMAGSWMIFDSAIEE
jgi:heme exporter protein B